MEVLDNDGYLTARHLVYLDTADWSYLERGDFPGEEQSLRQLGAQGQVRYLVSVEHFVEVSGLRAGLRSRIEYMREFLAQFGSAVRDNICSILRASSS